MAQPQVFDVMQAFRLALLRRERKAATRLVNAYGEAYQRLLPQIDALIAQIEAGTAKDWRRYKLQRLESLKRQIEFEVNEYAVFADREIVFGAREAINQAGKEARIMTQAALPGIAPLDARIMQAWNRLPTESVETLLGFLAPDSPLRASLKTFGAATADIVEKRLAEAIALGYNPRKIATVIRDDLGQSLEWSLRTARTTQIYSYREAARANYLANDHVVKGWIWRCARNDRTCLSCIAMDGTRHLLTERLNDHHNGRCFPEPETLTYRELGIDIDEPQPLVTEDAKAWFEKQPEARQRQMMGNGKYDAWKANQFKLDQLTKSQTDSVWGDIRVETPLKDLIRKKADISGWLMDGLPEGRPSGAGGARLATEEQRVFAKKEIISELSKRTGVPEGDVNDFIKQWAYTSNDHDMRSLAIQEDAAEVLETKLSDFTQSKIKYMENEYPYSDAQAGRLLPKEQQKRLISEMKNYTGERLGQAGYGPDDTITLYRGVKFDIDDSPAFKVGERVQVSGNVLESWTSDSSISKAFSEGRPGTRGVVFKSEVKVRDIVASSRSGLGCLTESEFVVNGANVNNAEVVLVSETKKRSLIVKKPIAAAAEEKADEFVPVDLDKIKGLLGI